jgi:tRNA A-37 threonylcarbamoyl transferase component Bud32
MMNLFIDPEYLKTLQLMQLDDFESIWDLEMEWFEEPNQRRGGWSGVGRIELSLGISGNLNLFIKKQENHGRPTWLSPIKGEPTFRREFKRLSFLHSVGFNAPRVIFYGESNQNKNQRAILVTVALDEYSPLENLSEDWLSEASRAQKKKLIIEVARGLKAFHKMGFVHRALYPKHIFIKNVNACPKMALIDLEKARYNPFFFYRAYFDLAALNRHLPSWTRTQRLAFLKCYFGYKRSLTHPLSFFYKWIFKLIVKRSQRGK